MQSILKFQHTQGILLLVAVTIFWGTTFPLVKETIVSLSPGTLIAIRCALAALAFAVHLRGLNKRLLRDGAILGLLLFASLATLWAAPELIGQLEAIATNFTNLIPIVYLALVTAATTWLPAIAQNSVSAQETAIIYTFEPAVAAVFSFWLLGEKLGVRGWLGAVMVLAAMILSQIPLNNFPIKIRHLSQAQAKAQEDVSESYQKLEVEPVEETLSEQTISYLEIEKTLLQSASIIRKFETISKS